MNKPLWIIRWTSETLEPLLWANYSNGGSRWVSYKLLFPLDEQYPEKIKLAHFVRREDAEAVAFGLVVKKPELVGTFMVEECWIKRCKKCYDCLCGEGKRKRE